MTEMELKENNRTLVNCHKQVRQFLDRWGPQLLDAAYSFKPQSTVANVTNFGFRDIYNDRDPAMRTVNIAAQVHDSVKTDNVFEDFEHLSIQIHRCMQHLTTVNRYNGHDFVLDVDVKMGPNWGHMVKVKDLSEDGLKDAWERAGWTGN